MPVVYKYVCLCRQICVQGEMVRESDSATYDPALDILVLQTKGGKTIDMPFSAVEFAIRQPSEPEAVSAPATVAKEPVGKVWRETEPTKRKIVR